jgi:diacylglycerol kinase (ATP)
VSRAVVITNPHAARHGAADLDAAVARLREGGVHAEVRPTAAPGHAAALAREALAEGVDLLVAHGGDGTVMDVATAVAGTDRAIGILPAGTGNRLADNLGIARAPRAAADAILHGRARRIDLGVFENASGSRHFAVAAGCGFDAELMHRTASRAKRVLGVGAYVATAVGIAADLPRAAVVVETDGGAYRGPAVMVLVANCGGIVPFAPPLAPGAVPDDGWFDVIVADAESLEVVARLLWHLMAGDQPDGVVLRFLRARQVRVSAEPVLAAQADGEDAGPTPFTATLLPLGLTVLAPA